MKIDKMYAHTDNGERVASNGFPKH